MPNEIIGAIFFGLVLAFQARTFIGNEVKKKIGRKYSKT